MNAEEKIVENFIKLVVRAFYDPIHIVIIDSLLREKRITDTELAEKLKLETRVVTKSLQELGNDLLVSNTKHTEKIAKMAKTQEITTW